jgi:cytochrome c551/c552
MSRSIAELAAYGIFAALLILASVAPASATPTSSASTTGQIPTTAASPDRGRLLFAAKGCIGCHTHRSIANARMQIGPDLTDLASRAGTRVPGLDARDYVRQSLREPGAYRVAGYSVRMPDLHLSDEEIASLSAFLLAEAH